MTSIEKFNYHPIPSQDSSFLKTYFLKVSAILFIFLVDDYMNSLLNMVKEAF
jgi:hypothetical protein